MNLTNSINSERIIYQLSTEDILNLIEEDEIDLELDEKDIDFIEQKVGENIDWRGAIEFALFELKQIKKKKTNGTN